jgi:uncharacterized membrane protein YqjE
LRKIPDSWPEKAQERCPLYGVERERRKIFATVLGLLLILTLSVVSDGFFLWLCLSGGSLRIYWKGKPLYTLSISLPFNLPAPLWIPFVSIAIAVSYLFVASRRLRLHLGFRIGGRRLHHYHLGALSLGIALLLMLLFLIAPQGLILCIASKRTNVAEVLEGLSLLFIVGGISLMAMDAEDLKSAMRTWLKDFKERLKAFSGF